MYNAKVPENEEVIRTSDNVIEAMGHTQKIVRRSCIKSTPNFFSDIIHITLAYYRSHMKEMATTRISTIEPLVQASRMVFSKRIWMLR
jgi:hypothetical protein